jgi:hypothetical protein
MQKVNYVPEFRGPWIRPIRVSVAQFKMIADGKQNFTVQEYLQPFRENEIAQLMEEEKETSRLTGNTEYRKIGNVVCAEPTSGIIPGWCVISLLPLDPMPAPAPAPAEREEVEQ